MQHKFISVTKRARYFQIGEANLSTKKVWIVCHGYGMLSEFFIKKFEILDDGSTLIIAPEALNRFYINENFSRVGASWITKLEKENDIIENNNYIESLYQNIVDEVGHSDFSLNVLGFSQGSSTACRWIFSSNVKINNLIIWAGDIPRDILTENNRSKWDSLKTFLVMGKKDSLITSELSLKFQNDISEYKLNFNLVEYDGDHRIFPKVLKEVSEKCQG